MILTSNKYKMKYHQKAELLELGFRHYADDPNNEHNAFYSVTFPVHKSFKQTTIEGQIITDVLSGVVFLEIYDKASGGKYPPFYIESSRWMYADKFITKMENKIKHYFKKFYIEEVLE